MSRLTDKYGTTPLDNVDRVLKENKYDMFVWGGKAIAKLKEFEDFMETFAYESLQHLEFTLEEQNKIIEAYEKENQALKERWSKLKEIISNKQHIKDKATDFVTLLGASGVEVFCEMLLNKMQKLEEEE